MPSAKQRRISMMVFFIQMQAGINRIMPLREPFVTVLATQKLDILLAEGRAGCNIP